MKRTLLLSSVLLAFIAAAVFSFLPASSAQTTTDEVSLQLLPVPANVIGTFVRGVSNDGKRIVFDSINDYNGRNVDSNYEIYVYDVDTRSILQITDTKNLTDPADSTKITLNVNSVTPAISGDGTKIVFVSNAALGGTTNDDGNVEIYLADLPRDATTATVPTITRITDTDTNFTGDTVKEIFNNYSPTVSDNGQVISFVSTRRTFKPITNGPSAFTAQTEPNEVNGTDGNGEIFLYSAATRAYTQVTVSRDVDATSNFTVRGFNSNPRLSGNGRALVFLSGFNYAGANANRNADFNGELFLYKVGDATNAFTQVTETNNTDNAPLAPAGGPVNLLPAYSRPLNVDGTLLVFESSGNLAGNNTQRNREIYLADLTPARPTFRQITDQTTTDATKSDYSFFPSINPTGAFITFTSVQNLTPATTSGVKTDNADASREVFRFDVAGSKFRQLTFAPQSQFFLDQRDNTTFAYADTTGSVVSFSLDADLLSPRSAAIAEQFQAVLRPITSTNATEPKLTNAASFDGTQVARGSIVAAFGTQLAPGTASPGGANFPFILNGVSINVDGIAAGLIFLSPGQINFVVPAGVVPGDAVTFTINNNGVLSSGKVKIVDAAPGVFSTNGSGTGPGAVQCGRVSPDGLSFITSAPPCSVGNSSQSDVLVIYGTGWRNVANIQVKIGDQTLTPSYSGPQPNFEGLDQINVNLTPALAAKLDQEITVSVANATPIDSNKTTTSFSAFQEAVTVLNAASYETFVARGGLALAQGTALSTETTTATGSDYPFVLSGVSVTVGGLAAKVSYVSPTQVNFVVPNEVKPADLVEVVVNNNGTISRGRIKVQDTAPSILTTTGDGNGRAVVRCGRVNADGSLTLSDPPCSVGTATTPNRLLIYGSGWRNSETLTVKIGDIAVTPVSFGVLPGGLPGVEVIDVTLSPDLAGKTDVDVIITSTVGTTTRTSKTGIKVSFTSN